MTCVKSLLELIIDKISQLTRVVRFSNTLEDVFVLQLPTGDILVKTNLSHQILKLVCNHLLDAIVIYKITISDTCFRHRRNLTTKSIHDTCATFSNFTTQVQVNKISDCLGSLCLLDFVEVGNFSTINQSLNITICSKQSLDIINRTCANNVVVNVPRSITHVFASVAETIYNSIEVPNLPSRLSQTSNSVAGLTQHKTVFKHRLRQDRSRVTDNITVFNSGSVAHITCYVTRRDALTCKLVRLSQTRGNFRDVAKALRVSFKLKNSNLVHLRTT